MGNPTPPSRQAADGSPYPDRSRPTFERDIQRMFGHIAERYDWFDHVASLGNDFLWRPRALGQLDRFRTPGPIRSVLDIGCGTGDLARLVARRYPSARVVAADFTAPMLANAQRRGRRAPEGARVRLARATALHLPFADASFDLVTNAFLARNLSSLPDAFAEMRRVLRPGGTLLTLEITEPTSPVFGALFHAYFDQVVPWMGAAVASEGPYRYLPESLKSLPPRPELVRLMRAAGFPRVAACPQSSGIVTTYLAEVPADQSR
ncbi:MAG: ubiquinone/menaquinone biosynthesis methyltransferase [Thermoplasmata archaeon]|jgi:demethylmenaquinone methyltransferase/2-methoxy-6-polyprenyl-1,4-benzoquinol methylase|nr:ubiquinone/menaquinone biosynthesis methyltransferase [Thermoplasmata archaeon]